MMYGLINIRQIRAIIREVRHRFPSVRVQIYVHPFSISARSAETLTATNAKELLFRATIILYSATR